MGKWAARPDPEPVIRRKAPRKQLKSSLEGRRKTAGDHIIFEEFQKDIKKF